MLGSVINIAFSCLVVVLVLCEFPWAQPKVNHVAFIALAYAWYATTTVWAAYTKTIEQSLHFHGAELFPSGSFWLTLLPQVLSSILITILALAKQLISKQKIIDCGEGLWQLSWYSAGTGFFFGQLFTVEGLSIGAPGLVFGVKVLEPLSTSLLAIPVLGQRCNWRLLLAVLVACCGILLTVIGAHRGDKASGSPSTNEWKVIFGACLANLGFSSRACVMKKAYSHKQISPLQTFWKVNVMAALSGLFMLFLWALFLGFDTQRLAGTPDGVSEDRARREAELLDVLRQIHSAPWRWFAACFCYFLYQCCSILLLDCLLVETHALLVAGKHIFVVILASIMSGSRLNWLMIGGIVVASAGVFLYSLSPADASAKSLLPHSEKKEEQEVRIPVFLIATLTILSALGLLSPFEYV